jgi:tRNA A37 threonylcarbamoyladenosine dehydratase
MTENIDSYPLWQQRTAMLIGGEGLDKLKKSHVLVVGLGGVGAYAAELICRAGVGKMTIVDGDVVEASNRNRQLPATVYSEGKSKAEIMHARLAAINPEAEIISLHKFIHDEETDELLKPDYSYVVDAIDSLSSKTYLIIKTIQRGLPLISSMGAGGKWDPSTVRVADISKTFNCRLAKAVRRRLRMLNVNPKFKTVFSPEDVDDDAIIPVENPETGNRRSIVGTISYMPAVFGCFCASVVIRELSGLDTRKP